MSGSFPLRPVGKPLRVFLLSRNEVSTCLENQNDHVLILAVRNLSMIGTATLTSESLTATQQDVTLKLVNGMADAGE